MRNQLSTTVLGLRSRLTLSRKPRKKRDPLEKSLLALLDTCIGWAEDTISERRIAKADRLQKCRAKYGLEGDVSVATVHNHLHALAALCKVVTLFGEDEKRQFSKFLPDAKERLKQLRPILLAVVKDNDPEQASRALNIS